MKKRVFFPPHGTVQRRGPDLVDLEESFDMRTQLLVITLLLLIQVAPGQPIASSQTIAPRFLSGKWAAQWITSPTARLKAYEVYHFRRSFRLSAVPATFVVHVSADARYKLFVNGKLVGLGPARSDLAHWNFDSYDLAPYLQQGDNLVASLVWNQGEWNGLAQHSFRTAFILQCDSGGAINTDERWKVMKDEAYSPVVFKPSDPRLYWQYYVAGALDSLQASAYPWGWEGLSFSDADWDAARVLGNGTPEGPENGTMWTLYPRPVGYLERTAQRFAAVRKSDIFAPPEVDSGVLEVMDTGVAKVDPTVLKAMKQGLYWIPPKGFPGNPAVVKVPAHSKAWMLLDAQYETTAYPRFAFSGGKGATVRIGYAETLLDIDKDNPYKWHKTDRDVVDGKKFVGVYDVFVADGGEGRVFIPLWMRVFRYVRIEVTTGDQPLRLDDISYDLVQYPFRNEAAFMTNDSLHQQIFDVCLRTIRRASQETYIDPYFEQMQYIGDTRLQALYAYYHFRDDALTRNAIRQFDWSRSPEGLTMSRYPSALPQYTPLYALCWMLMIKDYWMLRHDEAFIRSFVPAMLDVLQWYANHINAEGMLGDLPWLDFLDSYYPRDKILRASKSKSLTPYSLFYVYTVQQLTPLFRHFGKGYEIERQLAVALRVRDSVMHTCYDPTRGLFSDNPEKKFFSKHANVMAVLTGCLSPAQEKTVLHKVLTDTSLLPLALYFEFYEFAALKKAGMGGTILEHLGDWKNMLDLHLRTFTEVQKDPRSDCHSWSAYPAYYFLNTIAGIEPASPGFTTIRVEPNLGQLTSVSARMPHPAGTITADYKKASDGLWSIHLGLPAAVTGTFVWKGKTYVLKGGTNSFSLR
jgi:alpha-L-rhamnosidase